MQTFSYPDLVSRIEKISDLPQTPGVYLFIDKEGGILYVGKAKNIKNRVSSYILNKDILFGKTRLMLEHAETIKIIPVENEIESFLLEAQYIKKYEPKYNSRLKDDKMYPLVEITRDTYPKVFIVRRKDNAKSLYFGPYPSSGELKMVLKFIRRLFPFQSVNNHQKTTCLYYHLGLCPCPTVFDTDETKQNYKRNINHIIDFLRGNSKKVIKSLEKERGEYSKSEHFEKASLIQKKINAIQSITLSFRTPDEYEVNPQLTSDLRLQEVHELESVLKNANVPVNTLKRIECYDISNTSGTHATGSMVVAIDGQILPRFYRKFKIRRPNTPNDFAMHQEVMRRRLKHDEWGMPDLLIIDGGKGQVSSVLEVVKETNKQIPVVGIAKREETLITSDFNEIKLPKDSKALQLVMRLRDEAHRFAITYHKKLRTRSMTS